ncbi:MAG: prepilin peptidase [Sphingomonadaceae bacterium]|jgi:leader peptidase (prepilin peptidase)/N-methyltransferase|uniref:prepilin peptidase n=1 Tax=Sphingorhabdus sp. TaxID=1902408 RepID=UPI002FDB4F73|nr:prepilin peptidase [Sphingomonadaceae bacterium]
MLLALPFWYHVMFAMIFGTIWGSFIAALCSRWPRGERVSDGRSHCDDCQTPLGAKDLVPILSYLWLRGKCRHCGHSIGISVLYIELASAAIGLFAVLFLSGGQALAAAVFGWLLLPLVILDYQKLWLPNQLVLALAIAGVCAGAFLTPEINWLDRILGGIFGFLALEAIRQAFRKMRQVEGMGGGDPKLFGAIGLWLGWQGLPMTLLLATLFGFLCIALAFALSRKSPQQLPFGAYMGMAAFSIVLLA